jgi:hypothetical protein
MTDYYIQLNVRGVIPELPPVSDGAYVIYKKSDVSALPIDILLADTKLAVAKCIAGNLCRYQSSRKIGRKSHKEKCAVYELLSLYRALCHPCISEQDQDAILCMINGYCWCKSDCGCEEAISFEPPLSHGIEGRNDSDTQAAASAAESYSTIAALLKGSKYKTK